MRILKEKLKVRIRASGFNTINEGQLCCFVLFFLLNLFLTAQNINGFYVLDPDDVGLYGSYLYLLFFYLCSMLEYYLKDFYFVLFCFVFLPHLFFTAQNIHSFYFLDPDDVGLCLYSMNILVIKYPYKEKNRGKKMFGKLCIWSLSFTLYFNFVLNL